MKKWLLIFLSVCVLCWSLPHYSMDDAVRIEDFKDFPDTECSSSLRTCLHTYAGSFLLAFVGLSFLIVYYNYPRFRKRSLPKIIIVKKIVTTSVQADADARALV